MTDPVDLSRHAPGAIGALISVFLIRDTWPRRVGLFIAGVAAAYYVGPYVAQALKIDAELAGFLIGLFSMAVMAKIMEVIEALQPKEVLDRIFKKLGM